MPGTDPIEACRIVFGELPDLPHLPELPARGAGADMIGRTASVLVDLPVEIVPSGWRVAAHAGREVRRARDLLARDLDALEAQADGFTGALKIQLTGPWTLAAALELPAGHAVVTDHGATRDLAASLAEGLRAHLEQVGRRVPGANVVVQLDEPGLPAVLAGQVPTPSGYGTVRAVDVAVVRDTLRSVLEVAPQGRRAVHCCATGVPLRLLGEAGADAVAIDLDRLTTGDNDRIGTLLDDGVALWLGVLPSVEDDTPGRRDDPVSAGAARSRALRLWTELGFPLRDAADSLVLTPACGLAGASPDHVRRVLAALREASGSLRDEGV